MNNKRNPGHITTSRPLLALPCYVVSAHAAQHTIDRINVGSAIEIGEGEGANPAGALVGVASHPDFLAHT